MESNVAADKQNEADSTQKPKSGAEDDFVRNLATIHKSLNIKA